MLTIENNLHHVNEKGDADEYEQKQKHTHSDKLKARP